MSVMVRYSRETRKAAPALVFIEEFWLNKGFCFRIWGFMSVGVRNLCETHKIAPVLVYGGEIGWTRVLFQKR